MIMLPTVIAVTVLQLEVSGLTRALRLKERSNYIYRFITRISYENKSCLPRIACGGCDIKGGAKVFVTVCSGTRRTIEVSQL
jgi:hypothetical protein